MSDGTPGSSTSSRIGGSGESRVACQEANPLAAASVRKTTAVPATNANQVGRLHVLPCLDSKEIGELRSVELWIDRSEAASLGRSAVRISRTGSYDRADGSKVDLSALVSEALGKKVSIPPNQDLGTATQSPPRASLFAHTSVQVANETTLGASHRLVQQGLRPLALNFASAVSPGGGFLGGARAQEECLCRSSALYLTLENDRMYKDSRRAGGWCILSPDIPVFRHDNGNLLDEPFQVSFITCAAPVAYGMETTKAQDLMRRRVHRVLEIASSYGYTSLVLGAWGCGAYGNDSVATARTFRMALEKDFAGHFEHVIFAVTDWSPERKFLAPFSRTFADD